MLKLKEVLNKYHIYCDMDGVLTDFDRHFNSISPVKVKTGYEFKEKYGKKRFWDIIDSYGRDWWSEMPWMPDGKKLWSYLKRVDPYVEILSAPTKNITISGVGKRIWVERELGKNVRVNLVKAEYKMLFAQPNTILIDDSEDNIRDWDNAEGIGILFKSTNQVIRELQQLGLK